MTLAFLLDPVICRSVKKVDVATLLHLRKSNAKWNHFIINELEDRATKGHLKQIDFTLTEFQSEFENFSGDTFGNPEILKSFRLNIPNSLKYINADFWSKYSPVFLQLDITLYEVTDDFIKFLHAILSSVAPSLQKLEIKWSGFSDNEELTLPSIPDTQNEHVVFPNLTSLVLPGSNIFWNLWKAVNFIIDKSGPIDPTPNLEVLHLQWADFANTSVTPTDMTRWSKLSSLEIRHSTIPKGVSHLTSMCQAGMRLTSLQLDLDTDNAFFDHSVIPDWTRISGELSSFFASQAQTLHILILSLRAHFPETGKIRFPIFQALHTLKIHFMGSNGHGILDMGPLHTHFPKLNNIEVHCYEFLQSLCSGGNVQTPCPLERMIIDDPFLKSIPDLDASFEAMFSGVKSFEFWGNLLRRGPLNLPWKETLETLVTSFVDRPFKIIGPVPNLKEIVIREDYEFMMKTSQGIADLAAARGMNLRPLEVYLLHFASIRDLDLNLITFKFRDLKKVPIEVRDEMAGFFPFAVKFEQDEVRVREFSTFFGF